MAYRIFFWRYASGTKNYPGFHISADGRGYAFLLERINARQSMRMSRPSTFELTKPTAEILAVPNNGRHKAKSKPTLTVSILFDNEDAWLDIQEGSGSIDVSLSSANIDSFVTGIEDVRRGMGDYSMSGLDRDGRKSDIWFWWQPRR